MDASHTSRVSLHAFCFAGHPPCTATLFRTAATTEISVGALDSSVTPAVVICCTLPCCTLRPGLSAWPREHRISCSGERATLPTRNLMHLMSPDGCGAVCIVCDGGGALPKPSSSAALTVPHTCLAQTVKQSGDGHRRKLADSSRLVEARQSCHFGMSQTDAFSNREHQPRCQVAASATVESF